MTIMDRPCPAPGTDLDPVTMHAERLSIYDDESLVAIRREAYRAINDDQGALYLAAQGLLHSRDPETYSAPVLTEYDFGATWTDSFKASKSL